MNKSNLPLASARQACAIIDATLRLPLGTARDAARFLRLGGLLPSTRGIPTPLTWHEIGLIFLAVLLGRTCASAAAARVKAYSSMRTVSAGLNFGEIVASSLETPNDIFELRIDTVRLSSALTLRGADRGIYTIVFASDSDLAAPSFQSLATVGPGIFVQLNTAIKSAPLMRTGRRNNFTHFENEKTYGTY